MSRYALLGCRSLQSIEYREVRVCHRPSVDTPASRRSVTYLAAIRVQKSALWLKS